MQKELSISQNKRIVFLDILRLIAITMMVQGHTVDALLRYDLKLPHSLYFGTYVFIRGLTAPMFLFGSGFIYGLQFRKINDEVKFKSKFWHTIRRGLFLIIIGYIAKSPTSSPFYLSHINENLLQLFFAVDILQLIGFSLILFAFLFYLEFKYRVNIKLSLILFISFFLLMQPISTVIKWDTFFPIYITSWFSTIHGSLFPIFPWSAYLLFGSLIGIISYDKGFQNDEVLISEKLMILSSIFIVLAVLNTGLEELVFGTSTFWFGSPNLVILRMGAVLLLASSIALISHSITKIPSVLLSVSKNSLAIYIVHIALLYGSAWNIGINSYLGNQLNVGESIIAVIIMLILMVLFSLLWTQLKNIVKKLFLLIINKIKPRPA